MKGSRKIRRNGFCPFKGGPAKPRALTLREAIMGCLEWFQGLGAGSVTAWTVAKEIDALGSSVSSMMFKLANEGYIRRIDARTGRGGWHYSLS